MKQTLREHLRPLVYLSSNWLSLAGVVLVTTATLFWLMLLPTMVRGDVADAYVGIIIFLILPGIFFSGLALIPLGIWLARRHGGLPSVFPPLDLANVRFRRLLAFVFVTTVLNLVIGSQLTYRAVHYMESVSFCGQTCHTVMKPEFNAYQNSSHSRVGCVSCHIGPGANWFVKSKLSGAWQVVSVTFGLYSRPIPTPVHNLRPARETCEVCHWPQKFGQDRLRVVTHYSDGEQVEPSKTVLLMRIGGGSGYRGIHGAHMGPGVTIRYAHADEKREQIPWVEYSKTGEPLVVYKGEGYTAGGPGAMPVRVMDCMDCHNRPSHTFELPERSVDHAIDNGYIDASLPYARKLSVELLKKEYSTTAQGERELPEAFLAYYAKSYPAVLAAKSAAVEKSARVVLSIWQRNIFPEMNIKWGSYPNHIGHMDFTGCFRCHDYRAGSPGERAITQDCNACHQMLADNEKEPKILTELGYTPGNN